MKCQYCYSEARMVTGEKIYPHRRDLYHLSFFYCDNSHDPAYVGTHKDGKPLGTLADSETRTARSLAHRSFDKIWKDKLLSRSDAYAVLSKHMNLPPEKTHIGMFNVEQSEEVVKISEDIYNHILNKMKETHSETHSKIEFD